MVSRISFSLISLSSQTMSFLRVMMVLTLRSPRANTLSTMSCSTGDTSPSSVPSCMIDLISSSVTFDSWLFTPRILITSPVLLASSHTKGETIAEMTFIGPATTLETRSEALSAILFGTSSPNTMVR